MKTSTYYASTKPVEKEVTNVDLSKALLAIIALFFISTIILSDAIGKLLELIK